MGAALAAVRRLGGLTAASLPRAAPRLSCAHASLYTGLFLVTGRPFEVPARGRTVRLRQIQRSKNDRFARILRILTALAAERTFALHETHLCFSFSVAVRSHTEQEECCLRHKEALMKASSQWIRRAVLWGATGAVAAAMIVAATSAEAAHTTLHPGSGRSNAGASTKGPGYPAPKGIYAPFTDCPLLNPLMQESTPGSATGCVAGDVVSGGIKIGNITTRVRATATIKYPVTVQFGIWDPPNAGSNQFTGGILPPPVGGLNAQLASAPQFVRGGLLKALGCPDNKVPAVRRLCHEAENRGGKYLKIFASAQSAGPITNFQLLTWTQPVEFHLVNPLLGPNCYIGSTDNPVVLNPTLNGSAVIETDPHPRYHPDTDVIQINGATATDTIFTAPGVTGCGPGGTANIAVDEAIDTAVGLPSASGSNSFTLKGTFYLAATYAPQNMAKILLSAFRASARTNGKEVAIPFTPASLRHIGIRLHRH